MKANEALDKLYLLPNGLISYCRNTDEDIEYACADAFIEKACEWLQNHTMKELCMNEEDSVLVQGFIESFKNYMKRE